MSLAYAENSLHGCSVFLCSVFTARCLLFGVRCYSVFSVFGNTVVGEKKRGAGGFNIVVLLSLEATGQQNAIRLWYWANGPSASTVKAPATTAKKKHSNSESETK